MPSSLPKPYWLRGGIFGLVFALIFFAVPVLLVNLTSLDLPPWAELAVTGTHPHATYVMVGIALGATSQFENAMGLFWASLVALVTDFAIGAIVGLIVSKVKKKNPSAPSQPIPPSAPPSVPS